MISTIDDAAGMIADLCGLAGRRDLIAEIRSNARESGLAAAIDQHDSAFLFAWLMRGLSYQGISDRISDGYINAHGNADLKVVEALLRSAGNRCPLLETFETYHGCRYRKGLRSCSNPEALNRCPVPRLPLRKGALNQLAFSLALFFRDRCGGDFIGYLESVVSDRPTIDEVEKAKAHLVESLSTVQAVSGKLANMVLAEILLAGRQSRWTTVGSRMIAVDSLVHNFLHRTGILAALGFSHNYGSVCYGSRGCEAAIKTLSARVDARSINLDYPPDFPRFVQHAIWQFCAEAGSNVCNGRQIADRRTCERTDCPLGSRCSRIALDPDLTVLVELES
jgi:hypothetical protein